MDPPKDVRKEMHLDNSYELLALFKYLFLVFISIYSSMSRGVQHSL